MAVVALVAVESSALAQTIHSDGAGRLSASSGRGGFIADAPVHHSYWITAGDWVLCDTARDDGSPADVIVITGIRYVLGKHEPLEVRAYVRKVTPHQVASHPRKPDGVFAPFGALLGRPPLFSQSYGERRWAARGSYTREVSGTKVVRGCDSATADAYADADGKVPEHAWISLALAVKIGRDGGRVRRTLIDYTVGGIPHTLRIAWVVGGQGYKHHH
jgi:hypothetical protein